MDHYPNADVTAAVRGFGYKPVDESDFTNEIFLPQMVDFVYDLPPEKRRRVVNSFREVNHAVVDAPLILRIYRELYQQKVEGRVRARRLPYLQLQDVEEREEGLEIRFDPLLEERTVPMQADALILATGYRWSTRHPVLRPLDDYLQREEDREYRIRRDYSIEARPDFQPRIYLQGPCEETHGISETVLSLLPIRALDIWNSLRETRQEREAEDLREVPEPATMG